MSKVKISVAPKKFSATLIEKKLQRYIDKDLQSATKLKEILQSNKTFRLGPIVETRVASYKMGPSSSTVISELVKFSRTLSPTLLASNFDSCISNYLQNSCNMHKLFGILAVIGGWVSQITTGSAVEVNINK